MYSGIRIFSGNANVPLGDRIAQHLGRKLDGATVEQFSDGEINVDIHENVRGGDVFVLQSTSTPGNDHLMELLLMLDALKRAGVGGGPVSGFVGAARNKLAKSPMAKDSPAVFGEYQA